MRRILLLTVICSLATSVQRAYSRCVLPEDWRGNWYENQIGEVSITTTLISGKGTCTEHRRDLFLIENSQIKCHSCLIIYPRHANVLQYKESFCVGKEPIEDLCGSIPPDTVLHTLIRAEAQPAPCPFQGAFHFVYTNNSGGLCHQPTSYVTPCAGSAHFRFLFRKCTDAAYSYDQDIDMECLASWRDGTDEYVVVTIQTGGTAAQQNDRYRCAIFRVLGTVVFMAMSADSSCRGLRSANDGPTVIEFTQDVFGWPASECTFPPWVRGVTWRDLTGRQIYRTTYDASALELSFRPSPTSISDIMKSFRCFRIIEKNTTDDEIVMVAFVSHRCAAKHQCLKLLRRQDVVIEIHEGKYLDHPTTDPCLDADMLHSNKRLLIPVEIQIGPCAMRGMYIIYTGSTLCHSYFRLGCTGSRISDIVSSCSSKPALRLECLMAWKEERRRFLVATVAGDHRGMANCFSFVEKRNVLQFSVDVTCNMGAGIIVDVDRVTYTLSRQLMDCDTLDAVVIDGPQRILHQSASVASSSSSSTDLSPRSSSKLNDTRRSRDRHSSSSSSSSSSFSSLSSSSSSRLLRLRSSSDAVALRSDFDAIWRYVIMTLRL